LVLEKLLMVDKLHVEDDGENGRNSEVVLFPTPLWYRPISFNNSIASYASRFSLRSLWNKK
jgi:hypothetical protein